MNATEENSGQSINVSAILLSTWKGSNKFDTEVNKSIADSIKHTKSFYHILLKLCVSSATASVFW